MKRYGRFLALIAAGTRRNPSALCFAIGAGDATFAFWVPVCVTALILTGRLDVLPSAMSSNLLVWYLAGAAVGLTVGSLINAAMVVLSSWSETALIVLWTAELQGRPLPARAVVTEAARRFRPLAITRLRLLALAYKSLARRWYRRWRPQAEANLPPTDIRGVDGWLAASLMVTEELSAPQAWERSQALMRATWGETLRPGNILNCVGLTLFLPMPLLFAVLSAPDGHILAWTAVLVPLAIAAWVSGMVASHAIASAAYLYALSGVAPTGWEGWMATDLVAPKTAKEPRPTSP